MEELQFAFKLETDSDDTVVSIYHYACTVAPTVEYLQKPVCFFLDKIDGSNAHLQGHGLCRVVESKGENGRSLSVFVHKSEIGTLPKTGHLTDENHFAELYTQVIKPSTTLAMAESDQLHTLIEHSMEIGLQCANREDTVLTATGQRLVLALPEWNYRELVALKNEFSKRSKWAHQKDLGWKWGFVPVTGDISASEAIARARVALAQAKSSNIEFSYAS